ncbi:M23 family metallopeptidase [Candidatus Parcubacteria bacterium]|nr:M23 family metallopeptidase [Candidatus Parcubacteria bacterium]
MQNNIKLDLPLKDIFITQPFGVNYLDFYKKMGMRGHNGIDFRAFRKCVCTAAHGGKVIFAGTDGGGGLCVIIWHPLHRYKTIYYHLHSFSVKTGQTAQKGQVIGLTDNTGLYTTGDHLHFGLKLTDGNSNTINGNNGFRGAINPVPFFKRNWNKSNAYHRYGKKRNWLAEYWLRFTPIKIDNQWANSGRWIHRQLAKMGIKPPLSGEQVNAIIYGSWDFETVINPSMYMSHWGWLTKSEYQQSIRAFCR